MIPRRLLYRPDGHPRLVVPGLLVLAVTIALAASVHALARQPPTPEERAQTLSRTGHFGAAEAIYTKLVAQRPTLPVVLSLLDNHDRARADEHRRKTRPGDAAFTDPGEVMSDAALVMLLARLPDDVALAVRFVRAGDAETEQLRPLVEEGARRDPPLPWYNHLLGGEAEHDGRTADAAGYFEREGLAFPERRDDVNEALALWMDADDWDAVRRQLSDPRVAAAADAETKTRLATHDRDWLRAARWSAAAYVERIAPWSLAMTAAAALAWGFFCARIGRVGDRPGRRIAFYVTAFVLGVISVAPTLLLVSVEETKLRLVETGDPLRDALFYVFGVGLREEASKLLLFAPLLWAIRRWGDALDVLVCGAMVGLGFAAEENLNYLASGDLHVGLGRFLTANFFHMALTGTLAAALDDLVTDPERHAQDFSRTALLVIGMHGAYDFLIAHEEFGGGYFSTVILFLLGRAFLGALDRARKRADRGLSPLHAFVFALAVVTGVSAVHATVAVGPAQAALVMGEGLLGEAMLLVAFVRWLRGM
jgi:RsiW-degrading membrane proteinase PrsW (M82 family)